MSNQSLVIPAFVMIPTELLLRVLERSLYTPTTESHKQQIIQGHIRRLHYDYAQGNIPPDTVSNKEEEIDKKVRDKERTRLTDFALPVALLATGTGAGWLGCKQLKK